MLTAIAAVMTVGVYGLVAGIVKLDDAGLYLTQQSSPAAQKVGRAILRVAPWLMKSLSIVGTAAMFLVGGGILTHGIPWLHHSIGHAATALRNAGGLGGVLAPITPTLLDGLCGIIAGIVVLLIVNGVKRLRGKPGAAAAH